MSASEQIVRQSTKRIRDSLGFALAEKNIPHEPTWTLLVPQALDNIDAATDALRAERDRLREALIAIRDCAQWYGQGERLAHEVHHALVVEVYAVADTALVWDAS